MDLNSLRSALFSMQDDKYKSFHAPLIPTVLPEKIIGIRTPDLRKFASTFYKEAFAKEFIKQLPHEFYEENNLHAFVIEKCNDYSSCVKMLDEFLPYVDNWATCDMLKPKVLLKNKNLLKQDIKRWLKSDKTFVCRFGIVIAMKAFFGEDFCEEIANEIAHLKSNEYYVNSAIGWFFATMLTKNYSKSIKYLQENKLSLVAHNLAIKKARESLCIKNEIKDYLLTLKTKE